MSDSAIFNITSRNEGTEPVVIALRRGMVTVGELAWAVKGSAAPARIKLSIMLIIALETTSFELIKADVSSTYLCVNENPDSFE